jgi:hypothetical protein
VSQNGKILASASGKNVITCKLCPRRVAEAPPLEIPLSGPLPKSAQRIEEILKKHLMTDHRKEVEQAAAIASGFLPFLIWNAFDHQDPSVDRRIELIRAPIFAMVRKNMLTDDSLTTIVANFGLNPDEAKTVLEGMKAVRDACCEFGEHAPKIPQESLILQV